jgi:hypothetical protein
MTLAILGLQVSVSASFAATGGDLECGDDATVASGAPDPSLLAREASIGVHAVWCERYDALGAATRLGSYREFYPGGGVRVRGQYLDSALVGPIVVLHEDGTVFMRGFLDRGEWTGAFEIFHASGAVWFEADFQSGQLQGPLRTRYPDGALESETQYQSGREDGLARSFFPSAAGGRLRSEAHVEADQIVGVHRLLDRDGELVRSIDWSAGPPTWQRSVAPPAAPATPAAPASTAEAKSTDRD